MFMFRRFMYGRNGFDALSLALLVAALILNCINNVTYALLHMTLLYGLLNLPVYALLFYGLYRALSRNLPARRAELRKWQTFLTRLKDRENRYFHCPNCKQTVRVPRNRGKLNIRCPKCGERFTRKT
jgi:uncharacterized membrane protein